MAFQIRKNTAPTPKAKPVKRGKYLDFIRSLPCAVSGKRPVEAAHLSTANRALGHFGRGKGSKAPDRWALPLHSEEHRAQHDTNEMAFWQEHGIDPHLLALALFGLWSDLGDEGRPFAAALINQHLAMRGKLPSRDT